MSKSDLVTAYLALDEVYRRTTRLARVARDQDVAVGKVEREAERILKNEEEARAAFARRLQARTEAEDRLARMEKYDPGVGFLGYRSPARRRLHDMRSAVAEHARAAQVARERQELAVAAAKRTRAALSTARARRNRWAEAQPDRVDLRTLELELSGLTGRKTFLLHSISEADIDEAVMQNRVTEKEARRIRQALRSRGRDDFER